MKLTATLFFFYLFFHNTLTAQTSTKGIASYYADKFHGRTMSNGDMYHQDSMTCAHLKYPFGTKLLVRRLKNNKEVIVTVTDRGPYTKRFIIDLSRAAARQLGFIHQGICKVEITPYIEKGVPYRLEEPEKRDTIVLQEYAPIIAYPEPEWRADTTEIKKNNTQPTPKTNT